MTAIVIKKGSRVLSFVRTEKDKYSVIDEGANEHQSTLCATMTRKELLATIDGMV